MAHLHRARRGGQARRDPARTRPRAARPRARTGQRQRIEQRRIRQARATARRNRGHANGGTADGQRANPIPPRVRIAAYAAGALPAIAFTMRWSSPNFSIIWDRARCGRSRATLPPRFDRAGCWCWRTTGSTSTIFAQHACGIHPRFLASSGFAWRRLGGRRSARWQVEAFRRRCQLKMRRSAL